jgi:hypothetical protein
MSTEKSLWRDPDSDFDGKQHVHIPLPVADLSLSVAVVPRRTVLDEEALLSAVDENSQDCIVSNMGLHWVNDLPGTFLLTKGVSY